MKTTNFNQIALIIILLFSTNYAQMLENYYSPTVVDTRSFSMGNTQILSADGSNALFSNPAILSTLDNIQVQVGARGYWGNYIIENYEDLDAGYSFYPKFTNLSISVPIKINNSDINIALAGGYSNFLDWSWKYYNNDSNGTEEALGGINMLSFAISANLFDVFNIALSYSTSIYTKKKSEFLISKQEISFKNISFFTISIYTNPLSNLTIGAFIRPKYEMNVNSITTNYAYEFIELISGVEREIPTFWGIGIGYNFSQSVVVNAEYQNRPYGEIIDFYESGKCIRIGSEIKTDLVPIRVGFLLDDILANNQFVKDSPCTMFGFTLGTGYCFTNNLSADIGFQFNRYRKELISDYEDFGKYGSDLFKLSLGVNYMFD